MLNKHLLTLETTRRTHQPHLLGTIVSARVFSLLITYSTCMGIYFLKGNDIHLYVVNKSDVVCSHPTTGYCCSKGLSPFDV